MPSLRPRLVSVSSIVSVELITPSVIVVEPSTVASANSTDDGNGCEAYTSC